MTWAGRVNELLRLGAGLARIGLLAAATLAGAAAFAADPQISAFDDTPDPVPSGGLVTYKARIVNNAFDDALNVRVVVSVPAGASFVSATAPCAPVGSTVACALGTLAGDSSLDLAFAFRADLPGPGVLSLSATLTADNDVNTANNVQTQTTTVTVGADLALTASAAPDPVIGGANIAYTLTASNAGPNTSGNIVITDNLPPSVSYASSSGAGWSCSAAGSVVTCTHPGPHPKNVAIPPLTIVGTVNASGGTVTNAATVSPAAVGGTPDPDSGNNTATTIAAVLPGADLRIAQKKVISPSPAIAGQAVSFEIQPRNSGPADADNAVVTDPLPAGWTFVSAAGPNWACVSVGLTVRCARAVFPVGAADNIVVVAQAPSNAVVGGNGTTYTNTASIASGTTDPSPGNNSGSVDVYVLPDGADLRIAKTKTPNPVAQGATLTSTIVVTNNGPRVATGPLRVVEVLSGESYIDFAGSGSGWACVPDVPNGSTVVCTHPNPAPGLAVNASLPTLIVHTRALVNGTTTNTACGGSSVPAGAAPGTAASPPLEGDANPGNDCATVSATSTTVQPDLAIVKTTLTPSGGDKIVSASESSVTYRLVVANLTAAPGTDAATGVVIRDVVPAYIVGRTTISPVVATVSAGSATFNCTVSSATVLCTQTGGALQPGQTVTVPITVNRPMQEGSFSNTATVNNTAEGDPNRADNASTDTVQIAPIADIQLTGKSVTPAAVRAGEAATYVVSYRNNGPSPAVNVKLSDSLSFAPGDPGMLVLSIASTKPGSSCSIAAGAVLKPGSDSFTCNLGTLANGETYQVNLTVRPLLQSGNAARTVGNTATIGTDTAESPSGGDNGNDSGAVSLPVNPALVDLLTNKVDYIDPVAFSGNAFIDYRVTVRSVGPSFATGVRIVESMTPPAGRRIRFVCDTAAPASAVCNVPTLCSVTNATSLPGTALPAFTCALPAGSALDGPARGELAANRGKDVYLRFEVLDQPGATGDTYLNRATAVANEPDNVPGNDTADEPTTVRQRVELAVAKSVDLPTVNLRQPFVWTVRVVNNGTGDALQTDLTDTLPAGVVVTGPVTFSKTLPPASGTCTLVANKLSCALGRLNNGGVATIAVPARIDSYPAGGSVTNTASVDTDPDKIGGVDPVPGNNSASSSVNVVRASISGTVFEDRDRVGANGGTPQSAAVEPRIANVGIALTGTDAYGNAVNRTTLTDAAGGYSFIDLSPANGSGYTLTETQPAGFNNSPTDPPAAGPLAPSAGGSYAAGGVAGNSVYTAIPLVGGAAAVNYNFPELRRPTLSGQVYIDANLNGVRDPATDPPIANATVRLRLAATNALVASTTTDASGSYRFADLDPLQRYSLEQPLPTLPAGLRNGPVNPGSIGGVACASGCTAAPDTPSAGTDRIEQIDLGSGADGTQFNFGELQQSFIGGLVFLDANRNNLLDAGETVRLGGVTIRLVQGADCSAGTTLQTALTAADGSYRFDNILALQNYLVCQTQPPGYGIGSANGVAGSNRIAVASLPVAGSASNNFGETLSLLAGSVYQDFSPTTPANTDNGVRDAGETGIGSVPVTLVGRDLLGASVSLSTLTDASGNYRFDGLLQADAGGYTVTQGAIPPAAGLFNDGKDSVGTAGGSTSVKNSIGAVPLGAGVVAGGYLFGKLPVAPIGGVVYIDRNRNNLPDPAPTDGRIAGATVRLLQGASCASGVLLQTAATAADGSYSFSGASAGKDYLVCASLPAGYAGGAVNPGTNGSLLAPGAIRIANLPSAGSPGNQFGTWVGSLAGHVFLDADNDGARSGDAGIAGVALTLSGSDAAGVAVNRVVVTDADGAWRIGDLLGAGVGGYSVTQQAAQPIVGGKTTLNGKTTAGSAGGVATPVAVTPSAIAGIALAAGADAVAYNFGEILPVGLAGTVFIDLNDNGIQNLPGDTGIGGISLVASGNDDTGAAVSRTVTTAPDGSYSLVDLRPGTYTLTQPTQAPGTLNGKTIAGSAGGVATPQSATPSAISGIVLTTPGTVSTGNNFAELPNNGSVAGRVWLDSNANGGIDSGESGIAGVAIELSGTDIGGTAVTRSTTTDALGNYVFAKVGAGIYTLRQPTQPPGTLNGVTLAGSAGGTPTPVATLPSAIAALTLAPGQDAVNYNFGEIPPASIAGRVFADNNANGLIDAGEIGIAAVPLVLSGRDDLGNTLSLNGSSDAGGNYSFAALRPGTYTVTQPTQPPGTVNGITTAGSVNGTTVGTATPVGVLPSAISAIVLPVGAQSLGNNFGELGNSPDLLVTKASVETRFTVNKLGSYILQVRNGGQVPSSGSYRVSDRLPTGLTLDSVPAGNGWVCTGAVGAGNFTCTASDVLAAGATSPNPIVVKVRVGAAALPASPVNNVVLVEGGGEIEARAPTPAERDAFNSNPGALPVCVAGIAHNACRVPTPVQAAASLSGTAWYDVGSVRNLLDAGDRRLAGWSVEVLDVGGVIVARAVTGADGGYRIDELLPGVPLTVRFRDPQANIVWGYPVNGESAPGSSGVACNQAAAVANGSASSCPGAGASPYLTVVLAAGQNLAQQSLPVDPSGVVYDSGNRVPVPGSVVTLAPVGVCAGWSPATGLVAATLGGYTVDGDAVSMSVGSDGFYQFLFSPEAPSRCVFGLTVAPPAGYRFVSVAIPPAAGPLTAPGAPGSTFAVQAQAGPPTGPVGSATAYSLSLNGGSGGANVIHNHIPVDPAAATGLSLAKTGDKQVVEVGDSIRYTLTVLRSSGPAPRQVTIVDSLPAGFTYIAGTATVGGVPIADPAGRPGPKLAFNLGPMPASGSLVLQYRARVGVGSAQGDGINRAIAQACGVPTGCVVPGSFLPLPEAVATNEARYRVRMTGGVFTDEVCLAGKVFVDCNGNRIQDAEELGIPGVRLMLSDGTTLGSDSEGKYSVCGLPPRSHVLKVDPYTMPRGSRLTPSSNRNLGDAGSLWLDLKNGELHRADFIEGSCSNTVLEQVKARRAQGEVRTVEPEKQGGPALRFDSKAHRLDTLGSPQQGTDGANQLAPKVRDALPLAPTGPGQDESQVPVPALPMNRPPPAGRNTGMGPADAPSASGGSDEAR